MTRTLSDGHKPIFRGHHLTYLNIKIRHETNIPSSHDTNKVVTLDDRYPTDIVMACDPMEITNSDARGTGHRILDNPRLKLFNLPNFLGL